MAPPPRLESPIIQAGMGGGISRHELCAAVSGAGGLGTICTLAPRQMRSEIAAARDLTDAPVAVNLLLPFCGRAHFAAAENADVIVTFWGRPRRLGGGVWLHQCGSVEEALRAHAAGADGVIAQGVEAGGHVRGSEPALDLLERCRHVLPPSYPLYLAGAIAERGDVARALEAGARGAVCGTRFLLSDESHARTDYKRRLLDAQSTLLTDQFGLGWPRAPHRVVANEATRRWSADGSSAPLVRFVNAATAPVVRRMGAGALAARMASAQTAARPLFSPLPPTDADAGASLEAMALYAGEGVSRISEIRPAAELVRDLTP